MGGAPQLLGVNAGVVADQVINGAAVPTGHVKIAVDRPWVVTPTGIAGDQVAAHTDHLYAFDHAAYDHWADELGVERSTWPDGTFAENLTFDHLDTSALRLGDVLTLGTTVLVVTGPRIPCAKLTWRLGQPSSFMERFRLSGRAGVYLGVLEPGLLAPGDRLELAEAAQGSPTVTQIAEVASASAQITAAEHELLATTLASPHLSRSARRRLEARVGAGAERERRAARAWPGWRSFRVGAPEVECEDVASYALTPADGGALTAPEPGQHVSVRLEVDGQDVVRTWSLSEHREHPDRLRISVKALPGGLGTGALALAAEQGREVAVRAPAGSMTLSTSSSRPLVMVAAGIGVTPFVAMAQAHLRRAAPVPPMWLFLTAATTARTPFLAELEALFEGRQDHRLVRFVTQPGEGDDTADEGDVRRGRLGAAAIVETLSAGSAGGSPAVEAPWFEADHYLCGPPGFVEEVRAGLLAAGMLEERITTESFEAAHDGAAAGRGTAAQVFFAEQGVRARWEPEESGTLLDLGESAGLALPFDCRSGSCHACVATLVSGEVDGAVLDAADGRSRVLLCSAWPRTDEVVLGPAG